MCSSQRDEDCASLKRPEPARTCHLQPCASWQSGSWSKVSHLSVQLSSPRFLSAAFSDEEISLLIGFILAYCDFEAFAVLWHSLQCPQNCSVVGRRHRDVQCVDSQSKRPLRPFHCQAMFSRPPSTLTCPYKPCLTWITSPWGPVRHTNIKSGNSIYVRD